MRHSIQACCAALMLAGVALAGEPEQPAPVPQPRQPAAQPQPSPQSAPSPRPVGAPGAAAQPNLSALQGPPDVRDMTNSTYLTELAQVHLRFGALDRAEPLLRSALEKAKDASQKQAACAALATLLQRKGDWQGAVALYETAVAGATNPNDQGRLKLTLADACRNAGQLEAAEKLLLEVAQAKEDQAGGQWLKQEAQRNLLQLWRGQPAKLEAAIRDTEAAVAKDPKDAASLERLAELYTSAKPDPAKAAECYDKLCGLRPDDKNLQRKAGAYYQQTKQFDKAIAVYRRLLGAAAAKEEAQQYAMMVGQVLLQSNKKQDAVDWMKSSFAKEGASARELGMLAMFYEQAGMPVEAEAVLSQAETAAQSAADKADYKVRRGELATRQKDYAKAEELIRAALKDCQDNPAISSRANFALKRLESAKQAGGPPAKP